MLRFISKSSSFAKAFKDAYGYGWPDLSEEAFKRLEF